VRRVANTLKIVVPLSCGFKTVLCQRVLNLGKSALLIVYFDNHLPDKAPVLFADAGQNFSFGVAPARAAKEFDSLLSSVAGCVKPDEGLRAEAIEGQGNLQL
jgi:hypothetical protein